MRGAGTWGGLDGLGWMSEAICTLPVRLIPSVGHLEEHVSSARRFCRPRHCTVARSEGKGEGGEEDGALQHPQAATEPAQLNWGDKLNEPTRRIQDKETDGDGGRRRTETARRLESRDGRQTDGTGRVVWTNETSG